MKIVILAGGLPSTVAEEDEKIPKPMAEIGDRPILWHIMKSYSNYGFKDFIICTGYKGQMIKEFFMDYYIYQSDITVDLQQNKVEILQHKTEDWNVSIVDTGLNTSVIERICRVKTYLGQEPFMVAYGDCVSDIDINQMMTFHCEKKKWATIAVARPTGRNEILSMNERDELILDDKKYRDSDAWVNACTMIFEPEVLTCMDKPENSMEKSLFQELSQKSQIVTYKHEGFWSPMETRRDKVTLNNLWNMKNAPWKNWED